MSWTCPACGRRFRRSNQSHECEPAMSFPSSRVIEYSRIARTMRSGGRTYHVVNLRAPDELDDTVRAWLAEAYLERCGRDG